MEVFACEIEISAIHQIYWVGLYVLTFHWYFGGNLYAKDRILDTKIDFI